MKLILILHFIGAFLYGAEMTMYVYEASRRFRQKHPECKYTKTNSFVYSLQVYLKAMVIGLVPILNYVFGFTIMFCFDEIVNDAIWKIEQKFGEPND